MSGGNKVKKDDCEKAIKYLCHEWAKATNPEDLAHPSFTSFKTWLGVNGYGHYLNFHSVAGPDYDAERWFDEVFKLTWRS